MSTTMIGNLNLEVDPGQIDELREVVHIGMVALGEIERLQNEQAEYGREKLPTELRARHPSSPDDLSLLEFANALRLIELMAWSTRQGKGRQK